MQGINLTEVNFWADYHHALRNINTNSEEILKKLWDAIKGDLDASSALTDDDSLPAIVKMPMKKKM